MYHHILSKEKFESGPDESVSWYTQSTVAYLYGVPIQRLFAPTRGGARAAFARQVAMYLMRVVYRLSLDEIGLAFGRHRSTVAHACRRLEDLREDPVIDRQLAQLEHLLRSGLDTGARP